MTARQSILLIEDSDEDFHTTARAIHRAGFNCRLVRASDGDDALDLLHGLAAQPEYQDALPSLIFLDLNLPGTDGREVLGQIKSKKSLRPIPVIVLTTSAHERDINLCYELGANSYLQKPLEFENFVRALTDLKRYWFNTVLLPGAPAVSTVR